MMTDAKLIILGCYAATPRSLTHPTAQVLDINNQLFLIDCGEGTQMQLRRQKVKFSRIQHIFISHLHGDHCFGLIGLISTFSLLGRKNELHVYGPKGIKKLITFQLQLSKAWTSYPLYFHELEGDEPQVVLDNDKITIETIPLDHRIYTNGYLFKEKPGDRKLLIQEVEKHGIDVAYYRSIKKGKNIQLENGQIIPNEVLTDPPPQPKSYAFCSDTCFKPAIVEQIKGVGVLYHESTFLGKEAYLCEKTGHSTAKQAARIAKMAQVNRLILGHYSTRYKHLADFKAEAQAIFSKVSLAEDGKTFNL